jgi:acetyl-CoA/propionyl-CoA carboxylase biotin carboxyl carrier protein
VSVDHGIERKASFAVVGHSLELDLDGEPHTHAWAISAGWVFLADRGWAVSLPVLDRAERLERLLASAKHQDGEDAPDVRSPMPGTVVSIAVQPGQDVAPGQPLVSVEAMKMEHQLVAAVAGVVQLHVSVGDLVKADQVVATVIPAQD